MFGMSMTEIIVVLAIALIILGPEKLPKMARTIGRWMRQFRQITSDLRTAMEVEELRESLQERMRQEAQTPRIDPYAQAAAEDRKMAAELDAGEDDAQFAMYDPRDEDRAIEQEEEARRYTAHAWDYSPGGHVVDADPLAPLDLFPGVTAIPLAAVAVEASSAVTRLPLPTPPLRLLAAVVAVPIGGGLGALHLAGQE